MANILLIEDLAVIRRLIQVAIEPLGHQLTQVATGEEALQAIDGHRFDLILLDIGLPGLDGWEVLRKVRGRAEWATIPVVVVTAHGDQADEDLAMQLGANAFISKPFRPNILVEAVAAILG